MSLLESAWPQRPERGGPFDTAWRTNLKVWRRESGTLLRLTTVKEACVRRLHREVKHRVGHFFLFICSLFILAWTSVRPFGKNVVAEAKKKKTKMKKEPQS